MPGQAGHDKGLGEIIATENTEDTELGFKVERILGGFFC